MTGLVLFRAELLSRRSWRRRSQGIKMGVSDADVLHADTRLKWKCAFLGRPSPPHTPVSQAAIRRRIENCSIYTEWKGCARLSLNPLVCSIHLHFLCVLPVGYPLHGKHFIMGYLVPVWFRLNGWKRSDSAVVIVGAGPIRSKFTKQSDSFT